MYDFCVIKCMQYDRLSEQQLGFLLILISKWCVYVCGRSHMLQADSEEQCQAWIQAIQAGVSKAYNTPTPHLSLDLVQLLLRT